MGTSPIKVPSQRARLVTDLGALEIAAGELNVLLAEHDRKGIVLASRRDEVNERSAALRKQLGIAGERENIMGKRCPKCNSPAPHLHPAVQCGGEAQPCEDPFHETVTPENSRQRIAEAKALSATIRAIG